MNGTVKVEIIKALEIKFGHSYLLIAPEHWKDNGMVQDIIRLFKESNARCAVILSDNPESYKLKVIEVENEITSKTEPDATRETTDVHNESGSNG